jgi:hypothetical protein
MAAVGLALLVAAGSAQASSLAFVRDGDAWLTTPDLSREHRLTTSGDITLVSQADDGTIVVAAGRTLYRFRPGGEALNGPVTLEQVPVDIDVSPDGSKVAYSVVSRCNGRLCFLIQITDADNATPPSDSAGDEGRFPTWLSNDRLMYTTFNSYVRTRGLTSATVADWFADSESFYAFQAAITRAHDKLVLIRQDQETAAWSMRFYTTNGEPPAEPTSRCRQSFGSAEPSRPTWSPEGDALAWEQSDGVRVFPPLDLSTCAAPSGHVLFRATSPDFGPADVPAEPVCVVPKLKGRRLGRARNVLSAANCALGRVRKARSRKRPGTVLRQSVAAGQVRPAGTTVGVTVAKRR